MRFRAYCLDLVLPQEIKVEINTKKKISIHQVIHEIILEESHCWLLPEIWTIGEGSILPVSLLLLLKMNFLQIWRYYFIFAQLGIFFFFFFTGFGAAPSGIGDKAFVHHGYCLKIIFHLCFQPPALNHRIWSFSSKRDILK